jgi:glycosidase
MLVGIAVLVAPWPALAQPHPETIIQYFETPWTEVTARLPEIAAAGYTAVWLPPPTKGAEGTADVGFSVYDRFDLGDKDQRGTIRTKYGTKEEAIRLVEEAHRLGLKVYFDTIMNHNSNPAKIENAGAIAMGLTPVPVDQ